MSRVTMDLHPDSIFYDLPGGPVHPADILLAKHLHETKMRRIREMDLEKWAEDIRPTTQVKNLDGSKYCPRCGSALE